jgi:thiaminase/transcriptional activator TenA
MSTSTFTDELLEQHSDLWSRMLEHPFLLETRDGDIDRATFHTWLRQDYLFVEAAIPFVGQLIARAPTPELRAALGEIPPSLEDELELFEERAAELGVSVDEVEPGLVNHAYVQFLQAAAYRESFRTAFTGYWAAEKAYHASWKVVRPGLDEGHDWYPFVDNWAGEEFARLVDFLEGTVDRLADGAGDDVRERMSWMFEQTLRYEIAFWQMAWEGPSWPGLEEGR